MKIITINVPESYVIAIENFVGTTKCIHLVRTNQGSGPGIRDR